jgi:polysaccharide pyruvyl transferase CsaB
LIITIVGYFGFQNAGDEAILAGMLRNLRSESPGLRVRVICGDVPTVEREHGVEGINWQDLTAIGRSIQTSDLLIIGGGGLFHDYWGADPDTLLTAKHWGIAFYTSCALIAHLHRKPVMLYAVGVGPLISAHGKRLTRAACEIAAKITVRDEGSKALLISIGVPPDKVEVTADPAFSIQHPTPVTRSGTRPTAGVCIRYWSFGVYPEFLEREIARALDDFIDATGGSVLFIPFQVLSGAIEDDVATAKRVLSRMAKADRATVVSTTGGSSAFQAIQTCDVVLGMRLHAVIFSALAAVPCVVLSYDPKVDAIAQQLRPATRVIDVTGVDATYLKQALAEGCASKTFDPFNPEAFQALNARDAVSAVALAGVEPLSYSLTNDHVSLLSRGLMTLHRDSDTARLDRKAHEALSKEHADLLQAYQDLLNRNDHLNNQLKDEKQRQFQFFAAIDQYRKELESNLVAFRSQKAWQIMLAIRKAYTLLRHSKFQFVRFALGAVAYRFGNLAEYDLTFPDIRRFTGEPPNSPAGLPVARSRVPAQTTEYDVIVLSIIDFDFRFQRPQQIAVEMARRGHRIFWVSPSRFLAQTDDRPYFITKLQPNIWEVHLRCAAIDVYNGELGTAALSNLAGSLGQLLKDTGSAASVVYVQLPFWRRLALGIRHAFGAKILYDCMDDWDTFQNLGRFNVDEESALAEECDLLVVTGAEIERKFLARGLKPMLVRNGVDYGFFSSAEPTELLEGLKRPIVGYFGAIADWIDLDLIHRVAELRPQYTFVLIGQVFNRDTRKLELLPNVRLLGSKPYSEIPSYLYLFDACTIPFLLNAVTKATDPVKLYEYLSLGKPVVATAMAELAQCGDLIYIGADPVDFAEKLDLALSETDADLVNARIAFAKANTWSERVDRLDSGVRNLFPLVSILIVTHNSEEFVNACLDSILDCTSYPNYEIVAVDNASTDGTEALLQQYDGKITHCSLKSNTGFAAGNNQAAKVARGDFLLFLNIDTIVTSGWIHRLLRHVQKDSSIGLLCPVTNFAGNEVKVDFNYQDRQEMEHFAADLALGNAGKELDVQTAPLFCALVPRTVWDRVGELDVQFGMGMFEDDDFSLRVRRAGLRVATAEDCFIHHFGQGSFAKLPTDVYDQLFKTNQRRFEEKWGIAWQPHRPRVGARPLSQERRFDPATFGRARLTVVPKQQTSEPEHR